MLSGEFAREVVELPHPLDSDEERLVGCQARRFERVDLVTQVSFELGDVAADRVS